MNAIKGTDNAGKSIGTDLRGRARWCWYIRGTSSGRLLLTAHYHCTNVSTELWEDGEASLSLASSPFCDRYPPPAFARSSPSIVCSSRGKMVETIFFGSILTRMWRGYFSRNCRKLFYRDLKRCFRNLLGFGKPFGFMLKGRLHISEIYLRF